jgi:hypothetical protein
MTRFDWRAHLPVHPAAELFPLLAEAELKELAENIKANGLIEQINFWEKDGQTFLLDGRNRLDAMAIGGLLGIDGVQLINKKSGNAVRWKVFTAGDPYAIALSLNVHRRHLTSEQRRDLIAKVLKAQPKKSDRAIASVTKVDHKTVGSVRAEKEATGEIPQLKKTTGKDGKSRTTKPRKAAVSKATTARAPVTAPAKSTTTGPIKEHYEAELRRVFAETVGILVSFMSRPSALLIGAVPRGDLETAANFLNQIAGKADVDAAASPRR